jgi:TetR/AcrR family transcriptional regulator
MSARATTMPDDKIASDRGSSRDLLIRAASELMVERETVSITLSEIAERSGLNSALVKYYFGSKDRLLLAVLLHVGLPGVAALEQLAAADLPASRKMAVHLSEMVTTYTLYPYINRLMKYLTRDPETPEATATKLRFVQPFARWQGDIVRQGIASGEFRADIDPMLVYFTVIGACEALVDARYALSQGYGIETVSPELRQRYIDHVCGLVMHGLTA